MNLTDFLNKWSDDNQLAILTNSAFQCDPRTFRRWKQKTPQHARIALAAIDKLWELQGKNYNIFFEL